MEMLQSLGINATAAIQFVIFILTFIFLRTYVFSAYFQAYEKRNEKTKGGEELANEYLGKTSELQALYQTEARKVAAEINGIYQQKKGEALNEQESIVSQARSEAQKRIESSRVSIAEAVSSASGLLKGQVNNVALSITNKLLGK